MVLPIVVYGDPVLRKVAVDIDKNYEGLSDLISNMYETMYKANGLGIAAPQVGKSIRLFVVDTEPLAEDDDYSEEVKAQLKVFKKAFINAKILNESGNEWVFNEGCLSIPKINENVSRLSEIEVEYYDEKFVKHREKYTGVMARVIQHEYDHIEGKLFIDKIGPLKRKMLSGKLNDIANGKTQPDYKIKVYKPKK